jgi:hypothetical protein
MNLGQIVMQLDMERQAVWWRSDPGLLDSAADQVLEERDDHSPLKIDSHYTKKSSQTLRL